jgi:glutathione synthase/RimK-type ligase-like ATP-grasp enzyme
VTIVFATCEHQPLLTADDQILADALARLGIAVTPIPWTEIDPYGLVDRSPILLRSTWDYHRVPTMFTVWLRSLQDSGRTVWNDPAIALGNIDKIYLQRLAERGVEIPNTVWIDRPDAASVRMAMNKEGWSTAVLKPRIAATAYGTFLVTPETELREEDLAPARSSGALLQEFIAEIAGHGETSLVFGDGAFSHAVVKHAKAGDFRVQKDFGGAVELATPSQELRTFGDRVLQTLPQRCLYARVDVVMSARGPLLMELELIEPELYFLLEPRAAELFASAIARRLTGDLRLS